MALKQTLLWKVVFGTFMETQNFVTADQMAQDLGVAWVVLGGNLVPQHHLWQAEDEGVKGLSVKDRPVVEMHAGDKPA